MDGRPFNPALTRELNFEEVQEQKEFARQRMAKECRRSIGQHVHCIGWPADGIGPPVNDKNHICRSAKIKAQAMIMTRDDGGACERKEEQLDKELEQFNKGLQNEE